ncbi:MAG: error-prone DNA polymerase [Propionibacteriaceae bacterium]|nr:error-prone DNA polymerase [Propionibacteriaceae bacterium]
MAEHCRPGARGSCAAPRGGAVTPYAELHAHSSYSFLDGAASPESLVEQASRLGLSALALTDHDGLYGVVRFAEAAESCGLATVYGAELSLGLPERPSGAADPEGTHLLVLARGTEGYRRLARAITEAYFHPGAGKGRPVYDLEELAGQADGHWVVLTGCRKGAVRRALAAGGEERAAADLARLRDLFGDVVVELTSHRLPTDDATNDRLAGLAARLGLPVVATNAVHYATAGQFELACALAAVRARRSLDELDGWLPPGPDARLMSGAEMAARFARYPGAVSYSLEVAERTQFCLRAARPDLPSQEVPEGHTPMSWLRVLVESGRTQRYGDDPVAAARLAEELRVIEAKGFAGYFLIVYDITQFARERGILYQGRGSAAASAVCYVLGITVVDPVFYGLPFERFLSALREEEPDIDVDFDSGRREEVIQYVYARYGRRRAAQVSNVVTYRPRSAVRDMARALGYSPGQQDAWSKQAQRWGPGIVSEGDEIPPRVRDLATQVLGFPRHLSIHPGGMVLTRQPVGEVCPIEPARMDDRTVLQWDKDDCAWMGLVKFDLLGLGMLSAIQHTFDLVAQHTGERWTMDTLPRNEPGVYDMLCRADSIGVFQVESRAQIGTLPRLRPRSFYDLAVEIGLIRPGPIQGGAVHPYIRRRTGAEPVTYPHPLLEPVLKRTLGIPLFQEQLMQMAVTLGNCTAADADLLRRAMGSKRGVERIERLRDKLFEGMAANGITGEAARGIYGQIESFASFGFAESHALSFAVLVYASSWLKLHYPAAFLAALLRAQPMGFYSGATLTADARRHGVEVRPPDIAHSGVWAGLEPSGCRAEPPEECLRDHSEDEIGPFDPNAPDDSARHRRDGGHSVRLGLAGISGVSVAAARRIVDERERAPFASLADLARRIGLDTGQWEALSLSGALDSLAGSRRSALWRSADLSHIGPGQLGIELCSQPPLLPEPSALEVLAHDLCATGISTADHPLRHARERLSRRGAVPVGALGGCEAGRRIEVGGLVTHRQRPATAGGVTFLNLEDETGLLNVIVSPGTWQRYRAVARASPALIVRGIVERTGPVVNLYADRLEALDLGLVTPASRDFR